MHPLTEKKQTPVQLSILEKILWTYICLLQMSLETSIIKQTIITQVLLLLFLHKIWCCEHRRRLPTSSAHGKNIYSPIFLK